MANANPKKLTNVLNVCGQEIYKMLPLNALTKLSLANKQNQQKSINCKIGNTGILRIFFKAVEEKLKINSYNSIDIKIPIQDTKDIEEYYTITCTMKPHGTAKYELSYMNYRKPSPEYCLSKHPYFVNNDILEYNPTTTHSLAGALLTEITLDDLLSKTEYILINYIYKTVNNNTTLENNSYGNLLGNVFEEAEDHIRFRDNFNETHDNALDNYSHPNHVENLTLFLKERNTFEAQLFNNTHLKLIEDIKKFLKDKKFNFDKLEKIETTNQLIKDEIFMLNYLLKKPKPQQAKAQQAKKANPQQGGKSKKVTKKVK